MIPAGGPNGGDGGRGGNIVLLADDHMSTLMDFRYKRKYTAANGMDGSGRLRTGKDGEDLVLKVPRGTIIRDKETNAVIKDMSDENAFILAKGGRGGWGNKRFATATSQAPRFAKNGAPGQRRDVVLELKLLADVGLVGFPNVGKSSLLSVVSKAHPKIANYHFTTLFPNLGVVYVEEGTSFIMADIPGIIEGASEGAGLGHDFLRHIERCRLIIHVVDVSGSEGRDPIKDFEAVNEELSQYSETLSARPQLVAANKSDIAGDRVLLDRFRTYVEDKGYRFFEISAATHAGVGALTRAAAEELKKLPPIRVYEPEYIEPEIVLETAEELSIEMQDNVYYIEGPWMERLLDRVNLSETESLHYFDRVLRASGLYDRLEEMGIREGDTVVIYNREFEHKK